MAAPRPKNFHINSKTVVAPFAAFTMACLLYVYTRTSIRSAKANAQRHREADGGQISWKNENLRRHGQMEAAKGKPNTVDPEEEIKARKFKRREA
ncbi:MAG: hypothetical protein MMC33_005110 [Icmadophila ericetorum]|nr:hypothetical protein [Icmadophila ericetorum]